MYRITSHGHPKVGGDPDCVSCEALRNPHYEELLRYVKKGQRHLAGCCEHGHELDVGRSVHHHTIQIN